MIFAILTNETREPVDLEQLTQEQLQQALASTNALKADIKDLLKDEGAEDDDDEDDDDEPVCDVCGGVFKSYWFEGTLVRTTECSNKDCPSHDEK